MQGSVEQFLNQVARRCSWIGGGSVAAFSAALSAALLEKLVHRPATIRRLHEIRRECLQLVQQDADSFARVILATRSRNPAVFRRSLKQAIAIPRRVVRHATTLQRISQTAARAVPSKFHSDLRCAEGLAGAAAQAGRAFIRTNEAWLRTASRHGR